MKIFKLWKFLLSLCLVCVLLIVIQSTSNAYFGMYGLGGLYGGLYGMSGLGALGLYGMGGLYGLGGLGLLGGLYGGLYGMSGLGGLGLLSGMYGMGGMTALLSKLISPQTGSAPAVQTPTATASAIIPLIPLFVAEQAGTWLGTWTTGILSGQMTLNLIEDPLLGTIYGTAQLLGNPTLSSLVDVTGQVLNSQIIVSGSAVGLGGMNFGLEIIGLLVAANRMEGSYNLINLSSGGTVVESGSFSLALLAPII